MALIKCPECGKQVSDKAETCPNCGIDVQKVFMQYPQYRYQPDPVTLKPVIEKRKVPFGGVALAMSITSIFLVFLFIILGNSVGEGFLVFDICSLCGLITGILGLVFSSRGLKKVKWNRQAYTSIATLVVSKILSIVSISWWGIMSLYYLLFLAGIVG